MKIGPPFYKILRLCHRPYINAESALFTLSCLIYQSKWQNMYCQRFIYGCFKIFFQQRPLSWYDEVSANGSFWVTRTTEFQGGPRVIKKGVTHTILCIYIYYICVILCKQNHTKHSNNQNFIFYSGLPYCIEPYLTPND